MFPKRVSDAHVVNVMFFALPVEKSYPVPVLVFDFIGEACVDLVE